MWAKNRSTLPKLKIFPDCKRFDCPWDHIRSKLNLVDLVRDPKDADVHILIILEETSNGEMYDLQFLGQPSFSNYSFQTSYFSPEDNTEDMTRQEILRKIQLGLVPFLLDRPESEYLSIDFVEETPKEFADNSIGRNPIDPWNA